MTDHYRDLVNMVETELLRTITESAELPTPSRGRISRRVQSFPIAPRVELRPDEKAQPWLLNVSASDRVGLLYAIARVLASTSSICSWPRSPPWANVWKIRF